MRWIFFGKRTVEKDWDKEIGEEEMQRQRSLLVSKGSEEGELGKKKRDEEDI